MFGLFFLFQGGSRHTLYNIVGKLGTMAGRLPWSSFAVKTSESKGQIERQTEGLLGFRVVSAMCLYKEGTKHIPLPPGEEISQRPESGTALFWIITRTCERRVFDGLESHIYRPLTPRHLEELPAI